MSLTCFVPYRARPTCAPGRRDSLACGPCVARPGLAGNGPCGAIVCQGAVLQTATAQVGLWSVACGDAPGIDRRRRCIPRMSRAVRIWAPKLDCQLGKSVALHRRDLRIG
jgi:hypothetical protein